MRKQLNNYALCLLIHAGLAVSSIASAQAMAPNGVPSEQQQTPKAQNQALSKQQKLEVFRNIDLYQRQISKLESEEGVYGSALVEKLSGLGLALQQAGQHDQAISTFKRAIHLNRVNDGLYTTAQIPILYQQIDSHVALGQWKEVSDKYQYLYWLSSQNYGENDPRMIPTIDRLSKWHLQAYTMNFGRDRQEVIQHLITAHTMFNRSISLIEQLDITKTNQQMLIHELKGLTLTNYLFATFQRNVPIRSNTGMPLDPEARHSAMVIDHYISRSFRSGKEALNRVIDIYRHLEDAPPWAVARAKVKKADWLFLFNKRDAAFALYQEAYNMMTQSDNSRPYLNSIFGQPVALPNLDMLDNGQYSEQDEQFNNESANYVLASFDVTPQGSTENIEIIESKPQNNTNARTQVKRSLKIAKFRPRFVAGVPTLTEKMKLRVLSR